MHSFNVISLKMFNGISTFCWLQEGKGINRERPWLSVWYWTIKGWHEISMVCQLRNNCCDKQMISYWKQIDPFVDFSQEIFMYIKPIMIIQRIDGKSNDDILYDKWKQFTNTTILSFSNDQSNHYHNDS